MRTRIANLFPRVLSLLRRKQPRRIEDFCIPENLTDSKVGGTSPCGVYKLTINTYKTKEGCWKYTEGVVEQDGDHSRSWSGPYKIARNYSHFPFAWVERRASGETYLVCGSNYQGQTVVRCSDGKRVDYVPPEAKAGYGFCWASYETTEHHTQMRVEGCYWAGPYEVVIYEIPADPLQLPWKELSRDWLPDEDDDEEGDDG